MCIRDSTNTFGEFLAKNGKKQARIAETEKYAHVTFFFNGGVEEPNEGEDRILVKSPKVATYDLKPEMSAYEVCDKLVAAIKSDEYDVIVINFANPDMVGPVSYTHLDVYKRQVRDYLIDRVLNEIPYCRLNGHRTDRLPNNANFSFQFVEGESLLIKLDMKGICGSSGSACTSGSLDPVSYTHLDVYKRQT